MPKDLLKQPGTPRQRCTQQWRWTSEPPRRSCPTGKPGITPSKEAQPTPPTKDEWAPLPPVPRSKQCPKSKAPRGHVSHGDEDVMHTELKPKTQHPSSVLHTRHPSSAPQVHTSPWGHVGRQGRARGSDRPPQWGQRGHTEPAVSKSAARLAHFAASVPSVWVLSPQRSRQTCSLCLLSWEPLTTGPKTAPAPHEGSARLARPCAQISRLVRET